MLPPHPLAIFNSAGRHFQSRPDDDAVFIQLLFVESENTKNTMKISISTIRHFENIFPVLTFENHEFEKN